MSKTYNAENDTLVDDVTGEVAYPMFDSWGLEESGNDQAYITNAEWSAMVKRNAEVGQVAKSKEKIKRKS